MAVRHSHRLPLPVRAADDRPVAAGGDHADHVGPLREPGVPAHDQVLGKAVPDQLRPGRGHRDRAGVPVRHELVGLLPLRGRCLRGPAGDRGSAGVLPGVDVPGPVDLRLGSAVEAAAPGHDLAGRHRHPAVGLFHPRRQLLDAAPGRIRAQPGNRAGGAEEHLRGADQLDPAGHLSAQHLRHQHVERRGEGDQRRAGRGGRALRAGQLPPGGGGDLLDVPADGRHRPAAGRVHVRLRRARRDRSVADGQVGEGGPRRAGGSRGRGARLDPDDGVLRSDPIMRADLNTLWFALIAVLWMGYFFLEGFDFDFGVGILLPFLGRDDVDRRVMVNAIGPVWDGNEVWLLVAGGATFAAFPGWYATLFSGFYLALFLILLALIVRGVAFELRGKHDDPRWRRWWDRAIFLGSLVPALLWGVALGDVLHGVPVGSGQRFVGSFLDLLQPYALLGGVMTLLLFSLHGAVSPALKTSGELAGRARASARRLAWPAALAVLAFLVWSYVNAVRADNRASSPAWCRSPPSACCWWCPGCWRSGWTAGRSPPPAPGSCWSPPRSSSTCTRGCWCRALAPAST